MISLSPQKRKPLGMMMDPQASHPRHSVDSLKVLSPTMESELVNTENVQEVDLIYISGSEDETARKMPTKQERRKEQKRKSAQKKRAKERQNCSHLQSKNEYLMAYRERLKSDITKLQANERFYNSLLGTIKEMKALHVKYPQPRTSAPSPTYRSPPAERTTVDASAISFLMSSPSTSMLNDPVTMLPDQDLTQNTALETAAAQEELESPDGDVMVVSKTEKDWNQIPCDAEPRGPTPVRNPSASQLENAGCVASPPVQPLPTESADVHAENDVILVNDDNDDHDEYLMGVFNDIFSMAHKSDWDENPAHIILLDEQRGPLPTLEDSGSPDSAPQFELGNLGIDLQGLQDLLSTPFALGVGNAAADPLVSAINFT